MGIAFWNEIEAPGLFRGLEQAAFHDGRSWVFQGAVRVFVQLYNEGLIYRGDYMINWCPRCQTALADDEVDREDKDGFLWHISYRLADAADGSITIATTRPETIPGDHRHLCPSGG